MHYSCTKIPDYCTSEPAQNCLHVDRIPEHDHIDDKPECAELIFLPFAVALTKLTPFTAENDARNAVPTFSPIELCQRSPAHVSVVDVGDSSRKGNLRTLRMPGAARKGLSVGYSQLRHPFHRCAATATTPFRH